MAQETFGEGVAVVLVQDPPAGAPYGRARGSGSPRPPGAPFFNDTPKYVVSATLTTATWRNSQLLGPYDTGAIRRLKDEAGDLYVSGSGTLVRALLADGLVDQLHLFLYPLTRGSGLRLFPDGAAPHKLSLAACESYQNGVVYLAYRAQA